MSNSKRFRPSNTETDLTNNEDEYDSHMDHINALRTSIDNILETSDQRYIQHISNPIIRDTSEDVLDFDVTAIEPIPLDVDDLFDLLGDFHHDEFELPNATLLDDGPTQIGEITPTTPPTTTSITTDDATLPLISTPLHQSSRSTTTDELETPPRRRQSPRQRQLSTPGNTGDDSPISRPRTRSVSRREQASATASSSSFDSVERTPLTGAMMGDVTTAPGLITPPTGRILSSTATNNNNTDDSLDISTPRTTRAANADGDHALEYDQTPQSSRQNRRLSAAERGIPESTGRPSYPSTGRESPRHKYHTRGSASETAVNRPGRSPLRARRDGPGDSTTSITAGHLPITTTNASAVSSITPTKTTPGKTISILTRSSRHHATAITPVLSPTTGSITPGTLSTASSNDRPISGTEQTSTLPSINAKSVSSTAVERRITRSTAQARVTTRSSSTTAMTSTPYTGPALRTRAALQESSSSSTTESTTHSNPTTTSNSGGRSYDANAISAAHKYQTSHAVPSPYPRGNSSSSSSGSSSTRHHHHHHVQDHPSP